MIEYKDLRPEDAGREVVCIITSFDGANQNTVSGILGFEDGDYYICQDSFAGRTYNQKHGKKYTWYWGEDITSVKNFRFTAPRIARTSPEFCKAGDTLYSGKEADLKVVGRLNDIVFGYYWFSGVVRMDLWQNLKEKGYKIQQPEPEPEKEKTLGELIAECKKEIECSYNSSFNNGFDHAVEIMKKYLKDQKEKRGCV